MDLDKSLIPKRRAENSVHDTTLAGTYYTNSNQQKRISSAVFKDGFLYFKIPELQLYFEMRKVGHRFDGKMTVYGTSEKRAPEPMRMTKN